MCAYQWQKFVNDTRMLEAALNDVIETVTRRPKIDNQPGELLRALWQEVGRLSMVDLTTLKPVGTC